MHRDDTWPWSGERQRGVPHSEAEGYLAFGRELDARRTFTSLNAMVPRLTNGSASFEFRFSWEHDARLHDQHPGSDDVIFPSRPDISLDCTHFCLHSDATKGWLRELVDVVFGATARHS